MSHQFCLKKTLSAKLGDKSAVKNRKLEKQINDTTKEFEKKNYKLEHDNKSLEEKLKSLRSMNLEMQKKLKINQSKIDIAAKKMEKYDDLLLRISELDGKC